MYSKEELKTLKKDFWEGFDIFCSNTDELGIGKKKWILYDTKIKNVDLKFDATRNGAFVILEINHKNSNDRLNMFEKIEKYKNIIEPAFEEKLIWDNAFIRETGNEVCRIYIQKTGLDIHRRIQWMEFYKFMSNNMLRLEEVFEDIKDLIK